MWSHQAHTPNFKVEFCSAHSAIAYGVLAVAYHAAPLVPAPRCAQGNRRSTMAATWDRPNASHGRAVWFSGHQVCHRDSNFAGKDSQPRIGKRWEDVGADEVDMVVEVADEG